MSSSPRFNALGKGGLGKWLSAESLLNDFLENLYYHQGKPLGLASRYDLYMALAFTVRDRLMQRFVQTSETILHTPAKVVCYLSAEFLTGTHLQSNIINLGIEAEVRKALSLLDLELSDLIGEEEEPGLGTGGLGRLAACFLDSLATLQIPAIGYGIRYEFGIFDQEIRDGWQIEVADSWLRLGNPWEIHRPDRAFRVQFGGASEWYTDASGIGRKRWVPEQVVKAVCYDIPVLGYGVNSANVLRLWKAEAWESFDFARFNVGDFYGAVEEKVLSENISKVLYPNDAQLPGRELRLQQQHFFVSAALQDIINILLFKGKTLEQLPDNFAIQLNDTHPSLAVAELMRLLVDEHFLSWENAWEITRSSLAYTNHTLLPEAFERWPFSLLSRLLPRHLEIIVEINRRFLQGVARSCPGDAARLVRMSLIDEQGDRWVRMAHLACVGSHAVNGVAELHSSLLKRTALRDFYELEPAKFTNVTNGVTPRRFLLLANPPLASLISEAIGNNWITDLDALQGLERFSSDQQFLDKWQEVKLRAKGVLAEYIKSKCGIIVDPASLFDIQIKRIHEYKRQHLNVLHIAALYIRMLEDSSFTPQPRTFVFSGKAAPGYAMAKLIIKLINSVAQTVNTSPRVRGCLKVVFIPDFSVSAGEKIYPAGEVSEQISTAGKEASGTGNMKFALNGALTVGTLDGANVELLQAVGRENFFLFGLSVEQIAQRRSGNYNPRTFYDENEQLRLVINHLSAGTFSKGDRALFAPLIDALLTRDEYFLLADFASYVECQERVARAYSLRKNWARMSLLNTARSGRFSSDRAIKEYASTIWHAKPVPVHLDSSLLSDAQQSLALK